MHHIILDHTQTLKIVPILSFLTMGTEDHAYFRLHVEQFKNLE